MANHTALSILSEALREGVKTPEQKQREREANYGWIVAPDYFNGVTSVEEKLAILRERLPKLLQLFEEHGRKGLRPIDFAVFETAENQSLAYLEVFKKPDEKYKDERHIGIISIVGDDYEQSESYPMPPGPARYLQIVTNKKGNILAFRTLNDVRERLGDVEFYNTNFSLKKNLI